MARRKKLLSGNGWSFEPAGTAKERPEAPPPSGQRPKLVVEKRPGGRIVTVLSRLVLSESDRKLLARDLKNACGSGGTDRDGLIEIQGDHAASVRSRLEAKGWRLE